MEHVTKCRNRSRVALSSIFHPLESPKRQSSLNQGSEVLWARRGGQVPPLCSQSPCSFLSTKGLETCLCGCGASRGRDVLVWQSLPHGVQPLGAVAVCEPLGAGVSLGLGGSASQGLMLWDPLTDLSHCCGWRRALSRAGVSPRDLCTGCKSTWREAVVGRDVKGTSLPAQDHLQPALGPLLPRCPRDVSAHMAVPAWHRSVPDS